MLETTNERPRVLIGEDQGDVREALQILFSGAGYATEAAATPDDLHAKLAIGKYDMVLMDLNYHRDTTSGKEGLDILTRLHKTPGSPPVIVMTGWGSIELAVQAMQIGARDFIQKPWDNAHLLRLAEKHIAEYRAEQLQRFKQEYELEEAAAVQRRLMPVVLPKVLGVDIAGHCQPAGAVAGDYFDVLQLGRKLGLCIADVIGKGLPAALIMSNLQAAVRLSAAEQVSPSELCRQVNRLTCSNGSIGKYISFFYAAYDPELRTLTYSNAGHNPPVVVRANGERVLLETGDLVLGYRSDCEYHNAELQLAPGDCVVLYTDGLTEAGEPEEFGVERLIELFRSNRGTPASEMLPRVLASVAEHCSHNFHDDATCLVISVN